MIYFDGYANKCIVFDFDGTLVDTNQIKKQGFFDILVLINNVDGYRVMKDVYENSNGDRHTIWNNYAKLRGEDNQFSSYCSRIYSELIDKKVIESKAIPDAEMTLDLLVNKGFKLYLSSATPIANLRKIINARKWDRYFVDIFGSPDTKTATLNNKILPFVNSPSDVIVIGDGKDDQFSANQIGCSFIPVGNYFNKKNKNYCSSMKEVTKIILEGSYE